MRRLVVTAAALCLVSAGFFVAVDAAAAPAPVVSSIVEGREGGTNKEVIVVVGNNLTAVSQFNLADTSGVLVGQLTVKLKTKNLIVFGLPNGLAAAHYTLRLFYGKNASGQIAFDIVISNLAVPPASVTSAALDPGLRVDLDDATTLSGRQSGYFTDAANLTGTIDPARFSAYGDLTTELKIGTSAAQVAAGDHSHDANYLLRAGDTVSDAVFSFSASTFTPLATATNASAAFGFSGTNSAASGVGVLGAATSTGGNPVGVRGTTVAASGVGVHGDHTHATGTGAGVSGTTSSSAGAGVSGSASNSGASAQGVGVEGTTASGIGFGVRGTCSAAAGAGVFGRSTSSSGSAYGVYGSASSATGTGVFAQSQGVGLEAAAGTTGILVGTSAVANATNAIAIFQQGGVNKARIDTNGRGIFNGGTATSGADFAESVETARPVAQYEPGDVMVIDVKSTRRFDVSSSPNSKLVAGVYATKPGVLARNGDVDGDQKWTETEVPMAIIGIVPCKVCDENGAIEAGDLLVTSSTRGHAMKAGENPAAGTVVGKALGAMAKGSGKVEVLLIGR